MYTCCPGCQAVHPLSAASLAQGNGLYRCSNCNMVSNALQNLHNEWPSSDDEPPGGSKDKRELPVLGASEEPGPQPTPELTDEEAALLHLPGFDDIPDSGGANGRKTWIMALAFLVAITVINLGFISGPELLAQPGTQKLLESVGLVDPAPLQQYRNVKLIHLASSEMHAHPTLEDMLILNATIVNRADRPQPFPVFQVTLFDAHNQPLAARVFGPGEYLPAGIGEDSVMSPGVYLPVLLEIVDDEQLAMGFEVNFF